MTIIAGSSMGDVSNTIGVGPALVNTNQLLSGSAANKAVASSAGSKLVVNGWRPPQWSSPVYLILVPTTGASYVLTPLRVAHELVLRRTEHPVQSGAAITDHAYVLPTKLMMEIGVSDVMDIPFPGMWGGSGGSTSVNAFDALCELARQRTLVIVQTRLRSYPNMIVESVSAEETSRTVASGRFHVVFSEIFIASTQAAATARPDTTNVFGKGTVTPAPLTLQTLLNYVPSAYYPAETGSPSSVVVSGTGVPSFTPSTAIGAGTASSYSMQTIGGGAL